MTSSAEPATRGRVLAVAALFLLSGTCALVYEIAWTRMLVIAFGVSAPAMSTVLAAFMGGLALGGASFGRVADRVARPLRLYGWLELGIGGAALLLPPVLAHLDGVSVAAHRAFQGHPAVWVAVRFATTALALLVPTTLMGATLPVISRWLLREATGVGRAVGRFYALNTAGAVAGTIVAAFVLLGSLGMRGTIWLAAGVNVLIGVAALALDARSGPVPATPRAEDRAVAPGPALDYPAPVLRAVFWGFGLSGFAALGYEVVWSRLLAVSLDLTTTQSLSLILAGFLTGLAGGGALGARVADRLRDPALAFGILEGLVGIAGLASLSVLAAIPQIVEALGPSYGWSGHVVRKSVATLAVTGVPTLLLGALMPLAARIHTVDAASLGRRIGSIYAVNTCGAVLGAVAAGFVLIPTLGTAQSLLVLAFTNVGVGALVIALAPRLRAPAKAALLVALGLPAAALGFLAAQSPAARLAPGEAALVYYEEGAGGTVSVLEYPDGKRLLRVNGAGEVPTDTDSIRTFRLLGNLPMLVHPDARDVLVIAFGGGITLDAVAHHGPASIDCAELVPDVVRAAPWFMPWNHAVHERFERDRIRVVAEDGRNHLLRTERRYDAIISDATHPGTADSWLLYTTNFYQLARSRLRPGGVVAQWLPLHGLTADDHRAIVATFRHVFPHATLWLTPGYSVLLATPEPLYLDLAELRRRFAADEVRADLAEVDLGDPVSFVAALGLDEAAVTAYLAQGEAGWLNTDDRPRIGFLDRTRAGTASGVPALAALIPHLVLDPGAWVVAEPAERQALARVLASRYHVLLADLALKLGDRRRATEQTRLALRFDPGNRTAQRLEETLASQPAP